MRVKLVSVCTRVTLAFGTRAPVESVMVPNMVAVLSWAMRSCGVMRARRQQNPRACPRRLAEDGTVGVEGILLCVWFCVMAILLKLSYCVVRLGGVATR